MNQKKITVIPGDGIGPAIVESTLKVLDALDCGLTYEKANAGLSALDQGQELIPQETLDLIQKNKIFLKGPLTTPVGKGFTSINVALRQKFKLYANVRPALSYPGTLSRYENIDIVTVRENTEGIYSGKGQIVSEDGEYAEAMSVITQEGCEQIVRYGFDFARQNQRKKVALVHKANIIKSTSGLFLKTGREVAKNYPDIECEQLIVDNCCMQLVMRPERFDVIVTTNLFGDIISDLCAGLVGGLGLLPGANLGQEAAMFEAVHGSAPDIAGQNIANPTAIMLAAAMMLDHLRMPDKANQMRTAIRKVYEEGKHRTRDLGGQATTTEFTDGVLGKLYHV